MHIVVKQTDESIPVYVIRPEDAEGRELPVGSYRLTCNVTVRMC